MGMANVDVSDPPTIVVVSEPWRGEKYSKTFKIVGILQVIVGILAIILAIVSVAMESSRALWYLGTYALTSACSGIWTGIFAVAAGVLAIIASYKPESCQVTGGMIVSIFAAISAGIMFAIETPAAVYAGYASAPTTTVHGILSFLAFTELILAIVHSSCCCAAGCGKTFNGKVVNSAHHTIVTTTTYPNQTVVTSPAQTEITSHAQTEITSHAQKEITSHAQTEVTSPAQTEVTSLATMNIQFFQQAVSPD